ncbi:hypothetical protein NDU88_002043 [Pleurodeles waltl]|uniref:Uncharacterized protein n=1 Tax=Pleurodeles waltl TaxID=8319 RepID=A0AAV7RAU7_PLEWA|nr:hypothetical protein NDU88_002043 [Pleurodeles waltl]
MSSARGLQPTDLPHATTTSPHEVTKDRILQEITAVGRKLEGMDSTISSVATGMKSICLDIVGFQARVSGLEQRVATVEVHLNTTPDRDQKLLYLRSKLTDLEDRGCRDNISFFRLLEYIEGSDVQTFLRSTLPTLMGLTFNSPLEFQRAHRLVSKRSDGASRPRSIIACLMRHIQVHQILLMARSHGPFRTVDLEVRITADFSKETNDRRKAFLSLRPQLHQLDVKCSLFDPAQMWITKDGVSRNFYNPEDLQLYLDTLSLLRMDTFTMTIPSTQIVDARATPHPSATLEVAPHHDNDLLLRGRDPERLTRVHGDRDQLLQVVAQHTQLSDRQIPLPFETISCSHLITPRYHRPFTT